MTSSQIAQLAFSYPRRGLSGEFATFRLGQRVAEKYPVGSLVELVDSRSKRVLLRATVTALYTGDLTTMAGLHAHQAHNWKDHLETERSALLVASMKKRYPPGRVADNSAVTVIYLSEVLNTSLETA